jgi:hypothetical protein
MVYYDYNIAAMICLQAQVKRKTTNTTLNEKIKEQNKRNFKILSKTDEISKPETCDYLQE